MATTNQKHIAEAIHIVRTVSYQQGLIYFNQHVKLKMNDDSGVKQSKWFLHKCVEHGLLVEVQKGVFESIGRLFAPVRDSFVQFGTAVAGAFQAVANFNEANHIEEKD